MRIVLHYSRKALILLKFLYLIGAVGNYYFAVNYYKEKLLVVYPTYYNLKPLTKHFKMFSTPSNTLFISYKALRLLQKKVGVAIYILSTPLGIISHNLAIKKKIGGILLAFIFF